MKTPSPLEAPVITAVWPPAIRILFSYFDKHRILAILSRFSSAG
jgi:hypothetical protein